MKPVRKVERMHDTSWFRDKNFELEKLVVQNFKDGFIHEGESFSLSVHHPPLLSSEYHSMAFLYVVDSDEGLKRIRGTAEKV